MKKDPKWKQYEQQIFDYFRKEDPNAELLYDQCRVGRYSRIPRQIDILVKKHVAGGDVIGVLDCKCFKENVDVPVIDSMIGFIDDVGADFGGVVTNKGFSQGARNRAEDPHIRLHVIPFESPKQFADALISILSGEAMLSPLTSSGSLTTGPLDDTGLQ